MHAAPAEFTKPNKQPKKKKSTKKIKRTRKFREKKNVAKNFNYYFGLAHKTHELHNKGSPDAQFMPHKLEHFPKSKSTFYSR